ncbi:MAG: D-aminoacyl-tRNA deacylase [Pseudomonadota bacterium]|nr:D-tyrosyl-tRNA(Tyr) deacylase [Pseudomonadales bacterium]MDY6921149.1 D-aminoacyl-tRNA deacylase [Pseudomonadota bacterium]
MKALIQRVTQARVEVAGKTLGAINSGILLLLGVEKADTPAQADKLLHRVINYRIFADSEGKMNRSLLDTGGGLLVVSQFTLAADTAKGMRPSFSSAAPPEQGRALYEYFVAQARHKVSEVATGEFGADMQVSLINAGPVTFLLEVG